MWRRCKDLFGNRHSLSASFLAHVRPIETRRGKKAQSKFSRLQQRIFRLSAGGLAPAMHDITAPVPAAATRSSTFAASSDVARTRPSLALSQRQTRSLLLLLPSRECLSLVRRKKDSVGLREGDRVERLRAGRWIRSAASEEASASGSMRTQQAKTESLCPFACFAAARFHSRDAAVENDCFLACRLAAIVSSEALVHRMTSDDLAAPRRARFD